MKRLSRVLIVVVLLNVLAPLPAVMAQQSSASASSDSLREQIARLESIERDPETSAEVRELNRNFLLARRAQLRAALKKRISALESYLSSGAGILSSTEADAVSTSMRNLKAELQSLGGEASAKDSATDSNSVRFTPVSYTPPETVSNSMPPANPTGAAPPQPTGGAPAKATAVAQTPVADCDATLSDGDNVTYTIANVFDAALANTIQNPPNRDRIPADLVGSVLAKTLYAAGGKPVDKDYAITHVIEWGDVQSKAEAIRERWTLFQLVGDVWKTVKAQKGTRLYGHRRVHVLAIHLNASTKWDIDYTASVKKKTPTNVANVLDLLSVITSGSVAKKAAGAALWGGGLMCINAIPSDIEVQAEIIVRNSDSVAIQQPKIFNKTFDNEGKYLWDVSIGVPFKEVKEVQFNSDGGTVTAKEVTRQNAYGFLNIFFQKQDLTGDSFLTTPHLVLGVPLSKKPLDHPVVGLGYGIRKFSVKFDFYAGVVFNRVREPRTLNTGDPATQGQLEADFQTKRVRKFIFGVNLPLRQVKEALAGDN